MSVNPEAKAVPIKQRILNALTLHKGRMDYHRLFREVYPEDQYPKAYQYASGGGPPGGAMALGRAIRELGLSHYKSTKTGENIVRMTDKTRSLAATIPVGTP